MRSLFLLSCFFILSFCQSCPLITSDQVNEVDGNDQSKYPFWFQGVIGKEGICMDSIRPYNAVNCIEERGDVAASLNACTSGFCCWTGGVRCADNSPNSWCLTLDECGRRGGTRAGDFLCPGSGYCCELPTACSRHCTSEIGSSCVPGTDTMNEYCNDSPEQSCCDLQVPFEGTSTGAVEEDSPTFSSLSSSSPLPMSSSMTSPPPPPLSPPPPPPTPVIQQPSPSMAESPLPSSSSSSSLSLSLSPSSSSSLIPLLPIDDDSAIILAIALSGSLLCFLFIAVILFAVIQSKKRKEKKRNHPAAERHSSRSSGASGVSQRRGTLGRKNSSASRLNRSNSRRNFTRTSSHSDGMGGSGGGGGGKEMKRLRSKNALYRSTGIVDPSAAAGLSNYAQVPRSIQMTKNTTPIYSSEAVPFKTQQSSSSFSSNKGTLSSTNKGTLSSSEYGELTITPPTNIYY